MDVILLERIAKLGQMGEVVKVKAGFARNFLLPQKKALRATDENKKLFESRRSQLEAQNLEQRADAQKVAAKLDGLAVVLVRQAGEAGQLYGSVTARDISTAVTGAGFTVERRQVELNQPIKTLGLHPIAIDLHPEVRVTVTVNVARSQEEAETQARTGRAVVRGEQAEAEAQAEEVLAAAEALFEEGAGPAAEGEAEGEAAASAESAPAAEAAVAETETEAKPKRKKKKEE